jgi:hypothetical protein
LPKYFVILSEAKNLSFFSLAETSERFFASLRMTILTIFPLRPLTTADRTAKSGFPKPAVENFRQFR